jgi:cell division protein FtsB
VISLRRRSEPSARKARGATQRSVLGGLRALDGPMSRTEAFKARAVEARRRARRRVYLAWACGVITLAIAALVVFVFPTRKWVDQRSAISQREQTLAQLDAEKVTLTARIAALQNGDEMERIAREQYGFVQPGQSAYRVLAAPAPALPDTWPYALVKEVLSP